MPVYPLMAIRIQQQSDPSLDAMKDIVKKVLHTLYTSQEVENVLEWFII